MYTFRYLYSNQAHSIVHAKKRGWFKGNQQLQKEKNRKNSVIKNGGGGGVGKVGAKLLSCP